MASKGTQSITTYMHSLKQTTDLLASLGSLVSVEDMTDHVLRGLDDGYRAVIDGVNARDTAILFDDLLEKLLIHELSCCCSTVGSCSHDSLACTCSTQPL